MIADCLRRKLRHNFWAAVLVAVVLLAGCGGNKSTSSQPATASQTELTTQSSSASQSGPAEQIAGEDQPTTVPQKTPIEIEKPASLTAKTAPAPPAEKPGTKPSPPALASKPQEEKSAGPERILSLDVQIIIDPQGVMNVTETYKIFSEGKLFQHGLIRELPRPPNDDSHKPPPAVNMTVREASIDGKAAKWQMKNHGRFRWVFVSYEDEETPLTSGEHVISLKYRVEGQVASDSRLCELIWTTTGNWPFTADQVSTLVKLPGQPASQPATPPTEPDDAAEEIEEEEAATDAPQTQSSAASSVPATHTTTATAAGNVASAPHKHLRKKTPSPYEGRIVSGNGKEQAFQPIVQSDGSILFLPVEPLKKGHWLVISVRYPPAGTTVPADNSK